MEKKIKVLITQEANATYLGVKVGDVIELEMERYVSGVVGAEIGNAHLQACMAQAIAARSHIWNDYVSKDKPVQDSVTQAFQAYRADSNNYKNAQQGASDTKGMLLYYEGRPVKKAKYSNCNGGLTVAYTGLPYMPAQSDPWDFAVTHGVVSDTSHRQGMSQTGCKYAASIGKTYKEILSFYYPGTEIVDDYGEQDEEIPVIDDNPEDGITIKGDSNFKYIEYFQTKNPTYTNPHLFTPTKILLHSTGCNNTRLSRYVGPDDGLLGENQYKNYWNKETANKSVHGFIGKLKDGTIAFYNTLPTNFKCWGCGSGPKGSYNSQAFQFEMLEDNLQNENYYKSIIKKAEDAVVYFCKTLGIKSDGITSHYEAHDLGFASNHGDPSIWMKKHNDSMDKFRARVAARLGGEVVVQDPVVKVGKFDGKYAIVNTKGDAGLNLWSDTKKTRNVRKAKKGSVLFIKSDPNTGWVVARYDNAEGYVDSQYLVLSEDQYDFTGKFVQVNTKYDAGLNLWSDIKKTKSLKKIPKGTILFVDDDLDNNWVVVKYDGATGYIDERYLLEVSAPPEDVDPDDGDTPPEVDVDGLNMSIVFRNEEQLKAIEEFIANHDWN